MTGVTADTMPRFPITPSWGYVASPTYLVDTVELEGGFEQPNARWSRPLLYITGAPLEDAKAEDAEAVLNFYHAMGGTARYFRFKDYSDYKTSALRTAIAATDQPLVEISTSGTYQLVKHYTAGEGAGLITQVREIYKPIGSTFKCANETGTEQADTTWTLNEATGVLTPDGTFSGTPTTWGGEFEVEVRFITRLDLEVSTYGTRNARLQARERRRTATTG